MDRGSFRVEDAAVVAAVGAAARAACAVATLDMSPKAVRWERVARGVRIRTTQTSLTLDPLAAELSEVVGVGRGGVDTDWLRRRVPGAAPLF